MYSTVELLLRDSGHTETVVTRPNFTITNLINSNADFANLLATGQVFKGGNNIVTVETKLLIFAWSCDSVFCTLHGEAECGIRRRAKITSVNMICLFWGFKLRRLERWQAFVEHNPRVNLAPASYCHAGNIASVKYPSSHAARLARPQAPVARLSSPAQGQ